MPKPIQRRRAKGWRLPPGAVCVTRETAWGNPFRVGHRYHFRGEIIIEDPQTGSPGFRVESAEQAVALFRPYAELRNMLDPEWLAPLRGKDLACWCPLSTHSTNNLQSHRTPCHRDVLLEIANRRSANEVDVVLSEEIKR